MLTLIIGGLGFQDVSKDPDILDKEKEIAKCKHCGKECRFLKGG